MDEWLQIIIKIKTVQYTCSGRVESDDPNRLKTCYFHRTTLKSCCILDKGLDKSETRTSENQKWAEMHLHRIAKSKN